VFNCRLLVYYREIAVACCNTSHAGGVQVPWCETCNEASRGRAAWAVTAASAAAERIAAVGDSKPILIISGTNRPNSNALKVARVVERHYQAAHVPAELLSLEDLPAEAFLPGAYSVKPPAMVALQNRVLGAAGLHVVTPEYNGTFPGVLKYFIDLLKFPESFEHKPVAYIGESSGVWGALRSVEQLQMVFGYRHAHSYPVRVFISNVHKAFDADGNLSDPALDARLAEQVRGFAQYIGRVSPSPAEQAGGGGAAAR
jgi:NAD(P)H-dependent FMN reductase